MPVGFFFYYRCSMYRVARCPPLFLRLLEFFHIKRLGERWSRRADLAIQSGGALQGASPLPSRLGWSGAIARAAGVATVGHPESCPRGYAGTATGSRAASSKRTETIFETPGSCMVTP